MLKKILALALSSAIMSCGAVAFAEECYTPDTIVTEQSYAAKTTKWNGKTSLEAGKSYVVSSNVTISKKITVPSGTTLTVKNGAKLSVGTKGALYIKGTVSVAKGASLSVNGKLYEYKSGKLTAAGTVSLSKKSTATIKGKLTVKSTGVIKGAPKSLTLAQTAVTSIKGKNLCEKLDAAIDKNAISDLINDYFTLVLKDVDLYGAVKRVYPESYVEYLDGLFKAEGTTLKEYCEQYNGFVKELFAEYFDITDVSDVTVTVESVTDSPEKSFAVTENWGFDGNPEKSRLVKIKLSVKTGDGTVSDTGSFTCVEYDGEWYIIG